VGAAISPDGKVIAAQTFSNLDIKQAEGRLEPDLDAAVKDVECRVSLFFGEDFSKMETLSIPCRQSEDSESIVTMNGLRFSRDGKFLVVATGSSVVLISIGPSKS
jgi:hypothetical protein